MLLLLYEIRMVCFAAHKHGHINWLQLLLLLLLLYYYYHPEQTVWTSSFFSLHAAPLENDLGSAGNNQTCDTHNSHAINLSPSTHTPTNITRSQPHNNVQTPPLSHPPNNVLTSELIGPLWRSARATACIVVTQRNGHRTKQM